METIKVGDIVRVSEDAPQLYTEECIDWKTSQSIVMRIAGYDAEIGYTKEDTNELYCIVVPTKYLIKGNAEPKFSEGDKVFCMCDGKVYEVEGKAGKYHYALKGRSADVHEDLLEPYTGTEEQTIAEQLKKLPDFKKMAEDWATTISNGIREYGNNACRIMEEASVEAYWDVYTADLAKEIVLKIAGSQLHSRKPQEIGRMAVEIAKSVVENLKKKEE